MTSLTRDICPSCGAWLILVEVIYVAAPRRRYPDVGSRVVYECPSCLGVYETWALDDDPLTEMPRPAQMLRDRLSARRPVPKS
jgi:hypothetical protein